MKTIERTMSPVDVIVLLQSYYLSISDFQEVIDRASPSYRDAVEKWCKSGHIAGVWSNKHGVNMPNGITEKGRALVAAILSTPDPIQVWTTPDGQFLDTR